MEEVANKYKDMDIGVQEGIASSLGLLVSIGENSGMFQDEGMMIRPPPEPPPRMMLEAGLQLLCQLILFNFVLLFLSFLGMNTIVVAFCYFYFSQTLTLGGGDEGFCFGHVRLAHLDPLQDKRIILLYPW
ncbi:unnamed protein product [Cuscuta epithymum]|uniref:Uncharacterized protein n=1 Tax=Cuscuta epithymum TaxID=186058 RepID=A0AAV0C1M3_9ASTE|nr:unnamed protein product [Cuscuta epithymum]